MSLSSAKVCFRIYLALAPRINVLVPDAKNMAMLKKLRPNNLLRAKYFIRDVKAVAGRNVSANLAVVP